MKIIKSIVNLICGAGCRDEQNRRLETLTEEIRTMSHHTDELVQEVSALRTVTQSAVALLDRLTTLIQDQLDTGDLANVQTVLDEIKADKQNLADAVQRNTPAEPS